MRSEADFDRYVAEHNIPEEEWPEAFARWIAHHTGEPPRRFEGVEPVTSRSSRIASSATSTRSLPGSTRDDEVR